MELTESLCADGYRVQIGCSFGTYEDGVQAMGKGALGVTHLFNAMTGLRHRDPGIAGAALTHAQYFKVFSDSVHVHPGAIRAVLRSIPGLYCVSDSTAAVGMPEDEYRLGHPTVHKCLGAVRLADGTLAGSALTLDQVLLNLVNTLGLSAKRLNACVDVCSELQEPQRLWALGNRCLGRCSDAGFWLAAAIRLGGRGCH